MKKKILVLGISSFAGSSFANYVLKYNNYEIFGTYNKKNVLPFKFFLKKNILYKKIRFFKLNLSKKKNNLNKLVDKIKPNYIIDFASICMVNESWVNPKYYFEVNFFSKIDFIKNLSNQKKLKKYIYISTPEIFGSSKKFVKENSMIYNPSTPYASSKLAMEMFLNNFIQNKINKIVIARFSNFYGRGQPIYRLIPKLIYCINKKIKFPLHGSGNTKRNFIFDEDFNNGILKVITKGKIGSKYHFSGEKYFSIKEVIKYVLCIKKYSWNKLIKRSPERIQKDKNYYLDCKKTKSELNWSCKINLKLGIKKTIEYYDAIIEEIDKMNVNFRI
jgi:dTDP-glucose 4,6-dehydratase